MKPTRWVEQHPHPGPGPKVDVHPDGAVDAASLKAFNDWLFAGQRHLLAQALDRLSAKPENELNDAEVISLLTGAMLLSGNFMARGDAMVVEIQKLPPADNPSKKDSH